MTNLSDQQSVASNSNDEPASESPPIEPATESPPMSSERFTGVVKFYSVQKSYGFIRRDDNKEYVFVHNKSINSKNIRRVSRSLDKGEHVEFNIVLGERTPEAVNVTGIDLAPVIGSQYAYISMQWRKYEKYKRILLGEIKDVPCPEHSPRGRRYIRKPNLDESKAEQNETECGSQKENSGPDNKIAEQPIGDEKIEKKSKKKRKNKHTHTYRTRAGVSKDLKNEEDGEINKTDNSGNTPCEIQTDTTLLDQPKEQEDCSTKIESDSLNSTDNEPIDKDDKCGSSNVAEVPVNNSRLAASFKNSN